MPREMEPWRHNISDLPFFYTIGRPSPDWVLRLNGGGVRRDRVSKSIDIFLGVGYPTPQGNIPGSPSVSVKGDCGIFWSLTAPEEMTLAAFVTK